MLTGGEDDDHLDGGSGQDRLFGNAGNDVYIGGAGADTFVYNFATFTSIRGTPNPGNDTIKDFNSGADVIRVPGLATNLDTNNNGQLDDGDNRVRADGEGERSLVIDFNNVGLAGGQRGSGTLTVLGRRNLAIGTEISFNP